MPRVRAGVRALPQKTDPASLATFETNGVIRSTIQAIYLEYKDSKQRKEVYLGPRYHWETRLYER